MGFFDALHNPTYFENYEFGFSDIKGNKSVTIEFRPNEVEFKIIGTFSTKKVILKPNDILEVGLNQQSYRSIGKAAAGAVIGGILTGGIGLLAGAAMGGKRRKENQLLLVVRYMRTECDVVLSPSKNSSALYAEFKKLMGKQTKVADPIVYSELEFQNNNQLDLAAELEKIYALYQKGILTQEEFEAQKRKMLE